MYVYVSHYKGLGGRVEALHLVDTSAADLLGSRNNDSDNSSNDNDNSSNDNRKDNSRNSDSSNDNSSSSNNSNDNTSSSSSSNSKPPRRTSLGNCHCIVCMVYYHSVNMYNSYT